MGQEAPEITCLDCLNAPGCYAHYKVVDGLQDEDNIIIGYVCETCFQETLDRMAKAFIKAWTPYAECLYNGPGISEWLNKKHNK